MLQFTKNLAVAHAKNNIRVNCICPGYIETPLTEMLKDNQELFEKIEARHPMGRFGQPEEIAQAALFLASDESSFVTGAPPWRLTVATRPSELPQRAQREQETFVDVKFDLLRAERLDPAPGAYFLTRGP